MRSLKRQISYRKFSRVSKNLNSLPCKSYRYQSCKYEPEASVEAYVYNDFCYCVFLVNRGQDALERVYMRYWIKDNERADNFAYALSYDDRF